MSQQGIFVFAYHRRGQTPLWDKGRGWLAKVDPSVPRRHQEIRFERVSERLVHVAVHDAEAFHRNRGPAASPTWPAWQTTCSGGIYPINSWPRPGEANVAWPVGTGAISHPRTDPSPPEPIARLRVYER